MRIERVVTVDQPVSAVFAYLSDFTTTTEWDPGTVRTVRQSGDGGVGTAYHNTSRFLGRETELVYVVTQLRADELIQLRGENKTLVALDTMRVAATPSGGTTVTYSAEFTFKGLARFAAPLLRPAFTKLGDEAEAGMHRRLRELG